MFQYHPELLFLLHLLTKMPAWIKGTMQLEGYIFDRSENLQPVVAFHPYAQNKKHYRSVSVNTDLFTSWSMDFFKYCSIFWNQTEILSHVV